MREGRKENKIEKRSGEERERTLFMIYLKTAFGFVHNTCTCQLSVHVLVNYIGLCVRVLVNSGCMYM